MNTNGEGGVYIRVFFTLALVDELTDSRPCRFTSLGRTPRYPTGSEAGWAPEPVSTAWRKEYSWLYWDWNSDTSVVQPVVIRYIYYVTRLINT
jgi:hypothetical protein